MYKNIIYHLIRLSFKYFAPFMRIVEAFKMKAYKDQKSNFEPVFLIGAPRTGSTIVYQVLTNSYKVSFIDNLSNLAFRSLFLGTLISNMIYKDDPHNCFKSEFGDTRKYGLHAPNESGEFWYSIISRNVLYLNDTDVDFYSFKRIKDIYNAILCKYDQPLIIKNLNISLRLHVIKELFPNAKFIVIKREKLNIALSLLNGRLKKFGNRNDWFGIKPPNYHEIQYLHYVEQIVKQIYYIEKTIHDDIKLFAPENVYHLKYEDFCDNHEESINSIERFLNYSIKRFQNKEMSLNSFKIKNDKMYSVFELEIEKYDWENYLMP